MFPTEVLRLRVPKHVPPRGAKHSTRVTRQPAPQLLASEDGHTHGSAAISTDSDFEQRPVRDLAVIYLEKWGIIR